MTYRDPKPLGKITIARYAIQRHQRELEEAVVEAHASGHSWATIAQNAGVTRQAAHQKWKHLTKETK